MKGTLNEERILSALSHVDKRYVLEAEQAVKIERKNSWRKWCALAACFCLIFTGIFAWQNMYRTYMTESSYISIDVNPSLEFCLNKYNKVINVCAYNEDGQKVVDTLDVKNKPYTEAIEILLENETFQSYLTEESDLTFTIVSAEEEELQKKIEECSEYYEMIRAIYCADYEARQEAYENHCSTGKYMAYQELSQYDREVTLEECKDMTMHELHEKIKECEEQHHELEEQMESTNGQNSGHHHHEK